MHTPVSTREYVCTSCSRLTLATSKKKIDFREGAKGGEGGRGGERERESTKHRFVIPFIHAVIG